MSVMSSTLLSTTASSSSPWFNVAPYSSWSLYVQGLEAGATIAVRVSNWNVNPGTIVGGSVVDTGALLTTLNATGNSFYYPASDCPATWMQIVKAANATPANQMHTTVRIAGSSY